MLIYPHPNVSRPIPPTAYRPIPYLGHYTKWQWPVLNTAHKIDYTLNFFDQISINKRDMFVIILLLISSLFAMTSLLFVGLYSYRERMSHVHRVEKDDSGRELYSI